jgi:hypothetical protein
MAYFIALLTVRYLHLCFSQQGAEEGINNVDPTVLQLTVDLAELIAAMEQVMESPGGAATDTDGYTHHLPVAESEDYEDFVP